MKSSVFLLSTAEDCAIIKNVRKRVKQSKMRLLISCRGTKGPPDGPPIFLIFVKPLKWPQSQAYQSFLTFRSRFTLVGWAFWMSFIDLHRELDSTRCPEIGKTQNQAGNTVPVRVRPAASYRSKLYIACSEFFYRNQNRFTLMIFCKSPFDKNHT